MTAEERRAEYPVRIAAKSRALLSTPTVCGNGNRAGSSPKAGDGLATVAKRLDREDAAKWPTPCETDFKRPGVTGNPRDRLDYAVERGVTKSKTYPTPQAHDSKPGMIGQHGCGGRNAHRNLNDLVLRWPAPATSGGSLNPDWEEWLMCCPIGWTDLDTPNHRLLWLHPTHDPAAFSESSGSLPYVPRLTSRRKYRVARVKGIGNMQYPPTAWLMAEWGFALLANLEGVA